MNADELGELCLSLPSATVTVQWGDNRVYKIGGKMFAVSGADKDSLYSFKVDEHRFLELTDLPGVRPAPYLARAKWVQIEPSECVLDDDELELLVHDSYQLVFGKLPKKTQRELADSE